MPNPVLKYMTMFGSNEGYGWSEVHYKPATSGTPQLDVQLNNFILGPGAARQALLGEDAFIVGFRVSYPRGLTHASNGKRQKFAGAAGHPSAAPSLSLAVELQNADFTKSKICHLRGFWDSVELGEVYRGDLDSDWTQRLTEWIAALKNGYGWMSKDPTTSAQGDVLSYAVGATGVVTFTLKATNPMPDIAVGTKVFVSFSRFHNSNSILNRSLQVEVKDATTLVSVKPIGANPVSSTGKYNYRATSFVGYSFSDSISLGERRMGAPLNRRPGRSGVQALN